MERIIKFRAWDIIDKRIVTDGAIQIYNGSIFGHEDLIIMQYTGLKDKNGKEIYEGDIVEDDYMINGILQVTFGRLAYADYSEDWLGFYLSSSTDSITLIRESITVIGNIYENPNLLNNE